VQQVSVNQTPEDVRNRRKLKNYLINPEYQLKYVFWLGATGLLLTAINSSVFYLYIRENYSTLVELSPMTDAAKSQLYAELNQIVISLIVVSAVFMGVVAFLGLVISHKTAGPLYHFKRVFKEIHKGNHKARINLRPTDDFRDVAQAFNEMMDAIKGK
jgi:methyl-accepting chemotaxis protein